MVLYTFVFLRSDGSVSASFRKTNPSFACTIRHRLPFYPVNTGGAVHTILSPWWLVTLWFDGVLVLAGARDT